MNGDSRFTSPPSYSGWLGSCWFKEGKAEDRNRYIEQIEIIKNINKWGNKKILDKLGIEPIDFKKELLG